MGDDELGRMRDRVSPPPRKQLSKSMKNETGFI
jgi:hypothetical protein